MTEMTDFHISKAYFKTIQRHSNRPDELKFINAEVTKIDTQGRMEVYLDKEFIGTVPCSNETKIIKDGNNFTIVVKIDKPILLDEIPFRYQMKMYDLFGKTYTINNGKKEPVKDYHLNYPLNK